MKIRFLDKKFISKVPKKLMLYYIKDLWKSGLNYRSSFLNYYAWFVQDFVLSRRGLKITIVESKEKLL